MENIYQGNFTSWNDVVERFFDYSADQIKLNPEPEQVFMASYDGCGYDGDAVVAYRIGEKYYWVEGSHCSCYGLEGQWKPEEYDKETFLGMLDRKLETAIDSEYPSWDKTTLGLIRQRAA